MTGPVHGCGRREGITCGHDFVQIRNEVGRGVGPLTVMDECTRECLAIRADRHIRSCDVIEAMVELMLTRGVPDHIRPD